MTSYWDKSKVLFSFKQQLTKIIRTSKTETTPRSLNKRRDPSLSPSLRGSADRTGDCSPEKKNDLPKITHHASVNVQIRTQDPGPLARSLWGSKGHPHLKNSALKCPSSHFYAGHLSPDLSHRQTHLDSPQAPQTLQVLLSKLTTFPLKSAPTCVSSPTLHLQLSSQEHGGYSGYLFPHHLSSEQQGHPFHLFSTSWAHPLFPAPSTNASLIISSSIRTTSPALVWAFLQWMLEHLLWAGTLLCAQGWARQIRPQLPGWLKETHLWPCLSPV